MQERVIVGIDVGTTKVCVLVGELDRDGKLSIVGVGTCPSQGLRRGVVVNIDETVSSITAALDRAERLSGKKIASAYVGIAGSHIESENSKGFVAISPKHREIVPNDINRAIEIAQAISLPANREVIHVIPRGYVVDGQEGIKNPIGMSGFRLEVETHIITGASSSIHNLMKCVDRAHVEIEDLVLEPLASSEAVLAEGETDLGVALVDVGGGTTDIAIFADGAIWQTVVLGIGGNHITNDIAIGLRLPPAVAEELKVTYGHCDPEAIKPDDMIDLSQFMPDCNDLVPRRLLAEIIQARVEEMFSMVHEEIKKSGYDGLLPAGIVITGGCAELPGIVEVANRTLDLPARIGMPLGLHGLADSINRPAYATAVGLLMWGLRNGSLVEEEEYDPPGAPGDFKSRFGLLGRLVRAFFP
ncbi:cell division protein FtsA [Thermosporothrix hazakensis]|uniref:Cell division protein FtsA n=1 Tax=Thermosporothrix hazakensis TaxID=644383 RepID=A0A326U0J9_THEHA|nr:cell division protein FtsA [Thermosporothrix hazakensis]PZW23952.1 cell division protein FtsA [Thermosporothrix hazakensis]GCE48449.1 cell division protein FtsA [Thermosporothrix hazakensis]